MNKVVIQITAPISPGSSGGPLFNEKGEVIGIITFLLKETQNLNFAIPIGINPNYQGKEPIMIICGSPKGIQAPVTRVFVFPQGDMQELTL